ncbi:MAG: hypothetical protein ABJP34_09410 [Erythrobacter sp.]
MRPIILAAAPFAALVLTPALAHKVDSPATPTTQVTAEAEPKTEMVKPAEIPAEKTAQAAPEVAAPEVKEEKRICRRIRADASSRRKTKVCMTSVEWRKFNRGG